MWFDYLKTNVIYIVIISVFTYSSMVYMCCGQSAIKDKDFALEPEKIVQATSVTPKALNQHPPNSLDTISPALAVNPDGVKLSISDPCGDRQSYEAIKTLHRQLDDDASGDIDVEESDEFLRDELNYENGHERHKEFHGNDKFINVDELWEAWTISQVHNWTVQETVDWILSSVELPEYEHNFRNNGVDGTCLPRLAINSNSFLAGRLGIKDAIHRQKIALKAMDVVLFGEPKRHNYVKDAILALSLVIATGGCWFAYVQHKYSQVHLQKTMKDMEALQKAEDSLLDMQKQLCRARQAQEIVNIEKQDLERRLQDEIKTGYKGKSAVGSDQHRVRQLEEQLRCAQSSLHEAERRLGAHSWLPPPSLQHWLQLTHELELRSYNSKKAVAEQQLQAAKEACEKLSRKRSTLMGAFRIAHGDSIDDVDDRIMQAKTALTEVTTDLQERMHRWKQIERLCGFPIIQNPGLTYLETLLKPPTTVNGSAGSFHSGLLTLTRSSSEGNLVHEESPPPYAAGINIALANIPPPPKYSNASPSYGRKIATVVPPDSLHEFSHQACLSASTSVDEPRYEIHDDSGDVDDQMTEMDDDHTERSATPQSCSSNSAACSDVGRMALGDFSSDISCHVPEGKLDNLAREFDVLSSSYQLSADASLTSTEVVSNQQTHKNSQTLSEGKKVKKPSTIVSALKSSFSSSTSIASPEQNSSDSTSCTVDEKGKKKKKKSIFVHLRKKKLQ